jgi:hypothetical protein
LVIGDLAGLTLARAVRAVWIAPENKGSAQKNVWGAAEVPHGTSGPAPGLNHPETAVPLLPVGLILESSPEIKPAREAKGKAANAN